MGLNEAIEQKKVTFWKTNKNGEIEVNKTHNWFYQIQGQLHITQRKNVCLLFGLMKTNV